MTLTKTNVIPVLENYAVGCARKILELGTRGQQDINNRIVEAVSALIRGEKIQIEDAKLLEIVFCTSSKDKAIYRWWVFDFIKGSSPEYGWEASRGQNSAYESDPNDRVFLTEEYARSAGRPCIKGVRSFHWHVERLL